MRHIRSLTGRENRVSRSRLLALAPVVGLALMGATDPPTKTQQFDAKAAWQEFDALVRGRYGYLERPGVHGDAILRRFTSAAQASKDRSQLIDVLQLVAHNFADPHFIVGPLNQQDYAIFPTSADMYAEAESGQFRIIDVRAGSSANLRGIRPGDRVLMIDGQSPIAEIERVMGRSLSELSPQQINAGLNIALAGIRHKRRQILIGSPNGDRQFDLAPGNDFADVVAAREPLTVTRHRGVPVIRVENSLGNNTTIAAFSRALEQLHGASQLVIDLRNTPSGGNTTVARGIMGHFIEREHPYQVHVVPGEEREFGVPRKFVEYVLPIAPHYRGKVVVLGGHWTGSMGEGLMIGFRALGVPTAGSRLAHLLGALFNEELEQSGAKVDLGEEQLFDTHGHPREAFIPDIHYEREEASEGHDPLLDRAIDSIR